MECSNCRLENPEGMNFCGKCGQPLTPAPTGFPGYANRSPREYTPPFLLERILVNRAALEGERKYVTVFFADVAGFTTLSENLDPEDVHDIMDGCFELLGQEIHGAGGAINQYTGDGVMALFGAPVAYEDHIHRACHAALRIQGRMKDYTREVKRRYGVLFQLRMGINAGTVVVGAIGDNLRLDYTAIGDVTNLAARLEALANPGGIRVSGAVKKAAEDFFRFHDEGDYDIKGKKAPVTVFSLQKAVDKKPPHDTGTSDALFVNRQKELSILKRAYRTMREGQLHTVAVEGEPGAGKSRLVAAFRDAVQHENPLFLMGFGRPYGQTAALYPIARIFRSYFGIADHDSFKNVRRKIEEKIQYEDLTPRLEKIFELFGAIPNDAPSEARFEGEKRRMFRAVRDLLGTIVTRMPLILFLDDMQWVDRTTLDFLSFLSHAAIKGPLLLIRAGRTDHHLWCPEPPDDVIHLDDLDDGPSSKLFHSILGTDRLDAETSRQIIFHAGGNPLFLVEMAETIKRRNLLLCDSRICRLRLNVDALGIPQSIRGVLAARLDALSGSVKGVVQLAAVIGTEFSFDLLVHLAGDSARLNQILKLIENEGIIHRISSDFGGQYVFRHQMMQEIAYRELLKKNRRQYHHQVGEAMEKLYRNNLSDQTGFLSYHFYRAEDWQKALAYTLEAGDRAKRSFACGEALICFDRALDILQKGKWEHPRERALQIYKWKGGMLFCLGRMKKSYGTFQKMLAEASYLKDREAEGEALFRLGWTSFFSHKPVVAQKFLQQAIDLAKTHGLSEIRLKAASFQGFVYSVMGDLKRAKPLLIQALDLSEDSVGIEGKAWCLSYLIQYYNWTGELREALVICDELRQLNESLRSPFFHIVLHFRKGLICGALGNLKEAEEVLQAGLKALETGDEKFWKPRFLNTLGWIRAEGGDFEAALKLNQEALRLARPTNDFETIHNAEINVGENHLQMGDLEKAGEVLENVSKQIKYKRHLYAAWRYRTRLQIALAEFHGKTGARQKALYFVNQALKIARKNGALKHEIRALQVKAGIVHDNRPKMAITYLERASRLCTRLGSQRLLQNIRETMTSFDKPR
jgi:class 3 adenylate cyclase/tetratricopeptide (TPR) repeat protein